MDATPIRCSILRGGTSKGVFFSSADLPSERSAIERVLLDVMGSPDIRQIDGIGGATAQTSKVAIVGPSSDGSADVDYLFAQVDITRPIVDWGGTCGNLASAVGVFAVDRQLAAGLRPDASGTAHVRIRSVNTGRYIVDAVPLADGRAAVLGTFSIPGVPGGGACIDVTFLSPGGECSGRLLPSGAALDAISLPGGPTLDVSMIDAAVPVAFVRAEDVGLSQVSSPADIDNNPEALALLEMIRGSYAKELGLVEDAADAEAKTPGTPKIIVVGPPIDYVAKGGERVLSSDYDISARQISMGRAHQSFSVTGALALAAAAGIEGSVVRECSTSAGGSGDRVLRLGQPYGVMQVRSARHAPQAGPPEELKSVTIGRTARHLMDGTVWVRSSAIDARADTGA